MKEIKRKYRFIMPVLLMAAVMALLALPAGDAAAEAENLLVNGGAEAGGLAGWTDAAGDGGSFQAIERYSYDGIDVSPGEGSRFFFAGKTAGNRLYQDVDVSGYPDGTLFTLSGSMNGWKTGHGDNAYLKLEFLDAEGESCADDSAGEISVGEWQEYSVTLDKPEGTVTARVSLIGERNTGTDCDAYFDDIRLTTGSAGSFPAEDHSGGWDVENLLTNGDAEEENLSGWTDAAAADGGEETFRVLEYYTYSGTDIWPYDGMDFFWTGQTDRNALYQDVDVSGYPDGTWFTLSGYMNGWETGHGDNAYLKLEFLDAEGESCADDSVGEISVGEWREYSVTLDKPEGTVTARVSLIGERNTGTDCDAYFDNIVLRVGMPEEDE